MRKLISLSPAVAESFSELTGKSGPEWFCTHDPVEQKLGSGGGTVHLLREAWRAEDGQLSFADWVDSERGIIIHAGGQSRRLPAYAAEGKALIPVPVFRWSLGQRIDQTLLDLQTPFLERVMSAASGNSRWMIVSGDVMMECENLPASLPDADVVCLGIWGEPEQASRHGVFFTPRNDPTELSFMLQKPDLEEIRNCSHQQYFLLDVGVWLLSAKAMRILVERSGGSDSGELKEFDLYGTFGPAMGVDPHQRDSEINALTVAVVPLDNGEFYHFGSGNDLIDSSLHLQNRIIDQRRMTSLNIKPHPSLFVQNSTLLPTVLDQGQSRVWVENSHVPEGWNLHSSHILTGIPENDWSINLPTGLCVDIVPVSVSGSALRVYGITDAFRGKIGEASTDYCGKPFKDWLSERNLGLDALGLDPDCDIQQAEIFPVIEGEINPSFLQWLLTGEGEGYVDLYISLPKLSAEQISASADLMRIRNRRRHHLLDAVPYLFKHAGRSVAYQIDLEDLACKCASSGFEPAEQRPDPSIDLFQYIRDAMFRARLLELRGKDGKADEQRAFSALAEAMIRMAEEDPVKPVLHCLDDQIIWGRCPVRLDVAGGWADTPPLCFLNGGKVVNVAVELNGQPPIQVFARKLKNPGIRIRSIDLGDAEEIETFEQLRSYAQIGSGFAVPKAALALCGFLPEFRSGPCPDNLTSVIEEFGSGIELSLLCAVPKGSGLGTSSILAATLLGVLNEFCDLGWDTYAIGQRVLILEQMLTSGGGWQDQYGGLYRGLKYLETKPGLEQYPRVQWIDDHLLTDPSVQPNILLYYTGITRVAKNVLGEIVRGMFLNDQNRLKAIDGIARNAEHIREVLQEGSYEGFAKAVARSWELNQALDSGTNPPEVQALLEPIEQWIGGCKLLGAGGGGYLLILAKDSNCAQKIKEHLEHNPPNDRARFVSINVSTEGLQVTRS
ncbi:MAG: bifunctional fucokinase/fucose-1-phosphate guanylyltransferase [Puniceicoccaceae bacterium]